MFQSFFINLALYRATLLLQYGLLYVYITYRHHVNKRLSIYYAVKRTIAQTFNPRCRANSAKSNYMGISNPLNRVVRVCSNRDPDKLLPLLYLDLEHRIRQALGGLLH